MHTIQKVKLKIFVSIKEIKSMHKIFFHMQLSKLHMLIRINGDVNGNRTLHEHSYTLEAEV